MAAQNAGKTYGQVNFRVALETLEHWSEDGSEYIAFEIQTRCDIAGHRPRAYPGLR